MAWNSAGHEYIHDIAQQLLGADEHDQVRALLGESSLAARIADGASDFHLVRGLEEATAREWPATKGAHRHVQGEAGGWVCEELQKPRRRGSVRATCDVLGAQAGALLCALDHLYDTYVRNTGLPGIQPQALRLEDVPTLTGVVDESSDASLVMRWLVVLLGDLHQPLHLVQAGAADYGSRVQIMWEGRQFTLHQFFEEYLPSQAAKPEVTSAVRRQFQERAMSWGYRPPADQLAEWATDTARSACQKVYGALERLDGGDIRVVPAEVFREWLSLVEASLVLGGQHLAFVVQDTLERRRSSVDVHARRAATLRRRGLWNLARNLAVAAVAVPSLLFLFRWHAHRVASKGH